MTQGAKGILITPADSKAIVPGDQEGARRRRDRDRARHADRAAGRRRRAVRDRQHEGRRADRRSGRRRSSRRRASTPKIVMIDLAPGRLRRAAAPRRLPEGLRDQGRATRRSSATPTPSGDQAKAPGGDGEPAAEGPGHQRRLHDQRAVGVRRRDRAEGGRQGEGRHRSCPSTAAARRSRRASRPGIIDATSQQYPQKMAKLGVETVAAAARGREALRLHRHRRDADHRRPEDGVDSKDSAYGDGELLGLGDRGRPLRPPSHVRQRGLDMTQPQAQTAAPPRAAPAADGRGRRPCSKVRRAASRSSAR